MENLMKNNLGYTMDVKCGMKDCSRSGEMPGRKCTRCSRDPKAEIVDNYNPHFEVYYYLYEEIEDDGYDRSGYYKQTVSGKSREVALKKLKKLGVKEGEYYKAQSKGTVFIKSKKEQQNANIT